ncbi:hypothetical protein GDO81_001687 [Engystomops pustulosus]|uniref:Uncharacterized protein n=1 Tax=Engystomops pustulosus TaxID=76066 RepID=A0AAV7DIG4_ENGPU|nr:hypothetical protein GDO81_001687 [Engystomops pustulosus]
MPDNIRINQALRIITSAELIHQLKCGLFLQVSAFYAFLPLMLINSLKTPYILTYLKLYCFFTSVSNKSLFLQRNNSRRIFFYSGPLFVPIG